MIELYNLTNEKIKTYPIRIESANPHSKNYFYNQVINCLKLYGSNTHHQLNSKDRLFNKICRELFPDIDTVNVELSSNSSSPVNIGTASRPTIMIGMPKSLRYRDTVRYLDAQIQLLNQSESYTTRDIAIDDYTLYLSTDVKDDRYIHSSARGEVLISDFNTDEYQSKINNHLGHIILEFFAEITQSRAKLQEYYANIAAPLKITKIKYALPDNLPKLELTDNLIAKLKRNGSGVDTVSLERSFITIDTNITRYIQELNEMQAKRDKIKTQLNWLLNSEKIFRSLEVVKSIFNYFGGKATRFTTLDDTITITISGVADNLDRADWQNQWDNSNSNLQRMLQFNTRQLNHSIIIDFTRNTVILPFIRDLVKKLFVTREYDLLLTNTLLIQLTPLSFAWKTYHSNTGEEGVANPHLYIHNCWSESVRAMNNCIDNDDYETVPLYINQAVKTLSLGGDSSVMYLINRLYTLLLENSKDRVIMDKEGYIYTLGEMYEIFKTA